MSTHGDPFPTAQEYGQTSTPPSLRVGQVLRPTWFGSERAPPDLTYSLIPRPVSLESEDTGLNLATQIQTLSCSGFCVQGPCSPQTRISSVQKRPGEGLLGTLPLPQHALKGHPISVDNGRGSPPCPKLPTPNFLVRVEKWVSSVTMVIQLLPASLISSPQTSPMSSFVQPAVMRSGDWDGGRSIYGCVCMCSCMFKLT